ncbi:MAG: arsenosugar biosynthesis radical SAM (seleno)protein ArsS [Acidobacteriota bacterium]
MDSLPILRTNTFARRLQDAGLPPPVRGPVRTLQVNLGRLCNQSCSHCHLEAGPTRTERMAPETVAAVVSLARNSPDLQTVDITGGAPELNENFLNLIVEIGAAGKHVISRCNLTALLLPKNEHVPALLALNQVEICASLPCYTEENVDKQRGPGVFEGSIRALRLLNDLGYGMPGSDLVLNLVYNPLGAFLPAPQEALEEDYRTRLRAELGIEFNRLLTVVNMPIGRFAESLQRQGEYERYMNLLVEEFNEETVEALMCRSLISVAWDGGLYDCDFNQVLEMQIEQKGVPCDVNSVKSLSELEGLPILTDDHCFGCTAGAGSSCGGALA